MSKSTIIICLMLLIAVASCSKDTAPSGPYESNGTDGFYIGKIGTQRTYQQSIRWLKPGTDSAYVIVPDSLLNVVWLTPEELHEGTISIERIVQHVDSIPSSDYASVNWPYPYKEYKDLNGIITGYDLNAHLEAIHDGVTYSGANGMDAKGRFVETGDTVFSIYSPYVERPYLLKPLLTGRSWIREQWEYYDSVARTTRTHNVSARVVGNAFVKVAAGFYQTSKVEITYNWPDMGYCIVAGYEYYAAGVGLVLEESDMVLHVAIMYPNGPSTTIVVRIVLRNELASSHII